MIQDGDTAIPQPSSYGACPFCNVTSNTLLSVFHQPPKGETKVIEEGNYQRYLIKCDNCGHVRNYHSMDLSGRYYKHDYWKQAYNATKSDTGEIEKQFHRILAFESTQSDNFYRCQRVNYFFHHYTKHYGMLEKNLLDIGSGLSVFGHEMKQHGWHVTAVDPNPLAIQHALRQSAADEVVEGLFPEEQSMSKLNGQKFSLITLNKVLEHVIHPVVLLSHVKKFLTKNGIVYIELPDAISALRSSEGVYRPEFFIQHHHAFSLRSSFAMTMDTGLEVNRMARIHEPSGKYTIYVFATSSY